MKTYKYFKRKRAASKATKRIRNMILTEVITIDQYLELIDIPELEGKINKHSEMDKHMKDYLDQPLWDYSLKELKYIKRNNINAVLVIDSEGIKRYWEY